MMDVRFETPGIVRVNELKGLRVFSFRTAITDALPGYLLNVNEPVVYAKNHAPGETFAIPAEKVSSLAQWFGSQRSEQ